ncbi:3TM-type holin [Rhodospirillum sp. A1_3_36]|uniref:3TM-type holin n=1 Tax=Rhodospirillum sp. A1_3_36 TaxID=3391666 RepID=UPI0039A5A7FC
MWSKVISTLFGGGLNAMDGILGRFFVNKDNQEANVHGETGQVLAAYAAEFSANRGNRTWWDSLVDGLNRLPRPAMALGVMGLMTWAPIDPVGFSQAMRAYALVPEWLAGTLFGIAAFYFTARHFEKRLPFKALDRTAVRNALDDIRGMEAMRSENVTLSEREYQSAMDDGNTPLSNAAIAEWNRRRAAKM